MKITRAALIFASVLCICVAYWVVRSISHTIYRKYILQVLLVFFSCHTNGSYIYYSTRCRSISTMLKPNNITSLFLNKENDIYYGPWYIRDNRNGRFHSELPIKHTGKDTVYMNL